MNTLIFFWEEKRKMGVEELARYGEEVKVLMIEGRKKYENLTAMLDIAKAAGDSELLEKTRLGLYEHLYEEKESFKKGKLFIQKFRSSNPDLLHIPEIRDICEGLSAIYDEAISELSVQLNDIFYTLHGIPNPEEAERR